MLSPGGRLGLLWNIRDEQEDWVARLGEIIEPHRGTAPRVQSGCVAHGVRGDRALHATDLASFSHVQEADAEGVVDRVLSISFIAGLSESEREQVEQQVRGLLAEHPDTRGRETFRVPYRTEIYWCERI